jgi:hypothetical protein
MRVDRDGRLSIGHAVSLEKDDAVVPNDGDDPARHAVSGHRRLDNGSNS